MFIGMKLTENIERAELLPNQLGGKVAQIPIGPLRVHPCKYGDVIRTFTRKCTNSAFQQSSRFQNTMSDRKKNPVHWANFLGLRLMNWVISAASTMTAYLCVLKSLL
jgi:hypothetical protein